MTSERDPLAALSGTLSASWQRFLDVYEPLRPELYKYCRHLTRSPWDAEDLAQDTLARAFAVLGRLGGAPSNPRAWLFRVASNLWIDRVRRTTKAQVPPEASSPAATDPRQAREAVGTLVAQLSPQERAALVLKDVFDFSLAEIAESLVTTEGAVKAALHRAREKIGDPEPSPRAAPPPAVLDAFCAAFNARDVDRLIALLLDTGSVEVVGTHVDYGRESARRNVFPGMLWGSIRMASGDPDCGMAAEFVQGVLPEPPRCELRQHRGETLLLLWYRHHDGEAVRAVNCVELEGEHIARLRNYFYCPEMIEEVCRELEVPYRLNGYRSCLAAA